MAAIQLWVNREKRELDPFLFSKIAQEKAKKIDSEGRDSRGREKKNTSSQLRRFFDDISRLNIQAQANNDQWKMIKPQVHMMVAKMAYAEGRGMVTKSFVNLFGDTIREEIVEKDDLRVFANFFEAFMGFYKSYRHN